MSDRIVDRLYSSQVANQLPDIDLLIGCGDLPFYYLEFLASAINTRLVYVRGNHDRTPQYTSSGRVLEKPQGGTDLHGRVKMIGGKLVAGIEGSMRYKPNTPLMYSESEMTMVVARMIPGILQNMARYRQNLDILVTHSPPYGIHDDTDLAHTGFRIFLNLLRVFKPRLLVHGHMHVYRNDAERISRFKETTIVNVYPYRVIDLIDDEILVR